MSKEINKKFAKAKLQLKEVGKAAKNPFFKSKYADLNTHLELIVPELEAVGLDLSQPVLASIGANGSVATILIDVETGEEKTISTIPLPAITDPQKMLTCITYFRRGALNAVFNLKSVDDDGNIAAGNEVKGKKETSSAVPPKKSSSFGATTVTTTKTETQPTNKPF